MTKAKPKTTPAGTGPNNAITVPKAETETDGLATAKAILIPDFRHGMAVSQLHAKNLGQLALAPGMGDYADGIKETADSAAKGELAFVSRMLAAQAVTLDNVFAEMTRRAALNMGEYIGAADTYMRIAIKAQSNSRATLEALTKLHQPREQTVRHVHVNEGGQAVIADEFHHHTGDQENGKSDGQPQATGTSPAGAIAALPSPDPLGNAVPIPSRERESAMQDARRKG
jgi:hypothetical protein